MQIRAHIHQWTTQRTSRYLHVCIRINTSLCPTWRAGHIILFGLKTVEDGDEPGPNTETGGGRGVTASAQSKSILTVVIKDHHKSDLLLPLVNGSLVEDTGSQSEPVQTDFDGRQRTLSHDLLPPVLVEQNTAAHNAQERHCVDRKSCQTPQNNSPSISRDNRKFTHAASIFILSLHVKHLNSLTALTCGSGHMWYDAPYLDKGEATLRETDIPNRKSLTNVQMILEKWRVECQHRWSNLCEGFSVISITRQINRTMLVPLTKCVKADESSLWTCLDISEVLLHSFNSSKILKVHSFVSGYFLCTNESQCFIDILIIWALTDWTDQTAASSSWRVKWYENVLDKSGKLTHKKTKDDSENGAAEVSKEK